MPEDDKQPTAIGRYAVLKLLGAGAMGSVYLAEDPRIKRKIAIKMVKTELLRNDVDHKECFARFQREAEVSGLLNHPGIVAIYDFGESEAGTYLAMEFVEGRPLDAVIKSHEPMPLRERLRILAGIADALDHAHGKGIVHRDVKPGNVMLSKEGRPKLMDFGIAKVENASLTQTGTFLGTPSYASPEQIREGIVDPRSDIFSFGVMAFELLSGLSPFPGNSINTILYKIVNEPPAFPDPPVAGVLPEGWRKVFEKVLSKKPTERHPSCTTFMIDLVEVVTELDADTRRELIRPMEAIASVSGSLSNFTSTTVLPTRTQQRPRRSPWPWIGVAAGLLALGGAAAWYFRPTPTAPGATRRIASTPSAATVEVNGVVVGITPKELALKAGDRLALKASGYEEVALRVQDPAALPETFSLKPSAKGSEGAATPIPIPTPATSVSTTAPAPPPEPQGPGTLRFNGTYAVRVKEEGRDLGEWGPGRGLELPAGAHTLEVANPKVYFRETRKVTILSGRAVTVGLPAVVTVNVETYPGDGIVTVDGQVTGVRSTGESVRLASGSHLFGIQGRSVRHSAAVREDGQKIKFGLAVAQ